MNKRTLTVVLQFYKPLFVLNFIFNFVGLFLLLVHGPGIILNTFILKFVLYGTSVLYQYHASSKVYFYFRNAGYAVRHLYAYVFSLDFLIYIALITIYYITTYGYVHIKGR